MSARLTDKELFNLHDEARKMRLDKVKRALSELISLRQVDKQHRAEVEAVRAEQRESLAAELRNISKGSNGAGDLMFAASIVEGFGKEVKAVKSAKEWIDEYENQDPDDLNDFRSLEQVVEAVRAEFAKEAAAGLLAKARGKAACEHDWMGQLCRICQKCGEFL